MDKSNSECGMRNSESRGTPVEETTLFPPRKIEINKKVIGMTKMKKHRMTLNPIPMNDIRSGKKTIELRLYDEKRQKIFVGDIIKFVNSKNITDTLCVVVEDLFVFDSFDELYKNLPLLECGYTKDNVDQASPRDMESYYSREKQSKYGVIGIKISLI